MEGDRREDLERDADKQKEEARYQAFDRRKAACKKEYYGRHGFYHECKTQPPHVIKSCEYHVYERYLECVEKGNP